MLKNVVLATKFARIPSPDQINQHSIDYLNLKQLEWL